MGAHSEYDHPSSHEEYDHKYDQSLDDSGIDVGGSGRSRRSSLLQHNTAKLEPILRLPEYEYPPREHYN